MNQAIRSSSGKYVLFLGADDIPLVHISSLISKLANPTKQVFLAPIVYFSGNYTTVTRFWPVSPLFSLHRFLIHRHPPTLVLLLLAIYC